MSAAKNSNLEVRLGARKKLQRRIGGICEQNFLSATPYGEAILDFEGRS